MKAVLDDLERRVLEHPNRTAIIDGSLVVSFKDLGRWTDVIATRIASLGLDPAKPVAYAGSNGLNLIVAFIATQKAGLPFLPINASFPVVMITEFFERSNAGVCLTDLDALIQAADIPFQLLPPMPAAEQAVEPFERPEVSGDATALLQSSSGSTGIPKIIPYSRNAERTYIEIHAKEYRLTRDDVVAHLDTFWLESPLATLAIGAQVRCLHPKGEGIVEIIEGMNASKVTILPVYPSLFRMFSEVDRALPDLRLVMLSGEEIKKLEIEIFDSITVPGSVLLNCYASMEATCVTTYRYTKGDVISSQALPAGHVLAPLVVEICDGDGSVLPDGEIGEIVVVSDLLPTHYIGDPERSAQVFGTNENCVRTFSSGDFGYFDSHRNLRYIARRDDQVRISGFNVQMPVIEAEIKRHDKVLDCAVIAVEGKRQSKKLHAFYVGDSSDQSIKRHLGEVFPPYMIPASFQQIEAIPKTVTGKVRRTELRQHLMETQSSVSETLSGNLQKIAEIWESLLHHTEFTTADNFFDVGGDSLRAMELLMEVEVAFGARISLDRFILMGATIKEIDWALGDKDVAHLRLLKPGKSRRKILVAHGWDGGVSSYFDVANAFDRDTEVVGITANYVGRTRSMSIVDKAAEAVRYLPDEPERTLVGYSFAGPLAMEIARLTPQTRTSMVLIDPYSKHHRLFKRLRFWGASIEERFGRKRPLGYERSFPRDHIYDPDPVDLESALLIRGTEFPQYALAHWQRLCGHRLHVIEHTGRHGPMMRGAGALQIAEQISNWLDVLGND
jgi:acyl-CoA synthetase (AMP-forming)/AMP-acid ligase II